MTIIGTPYFVSRQKAILYYRDYEGDYAAQAVERKIESGEIHIGVPPNGLYGKEGGKIIIIDNGTRYAIEE